MEKIIAACATDDGTAFIERHFGDAQKFDIYQLNEDGFECIGSVMNTAPEERQHADPRKAAGIGAVLKERKVNVLVSRQFGPNLKRVRKQFVPVIARVSIVEEGLKLVRDNIDRVLEELKRGEERNHLVLRGQASDKSEKPAKKTSDKAATTAPYKPDKAARKSATKAPFFIPYQQPDEPPREAGLIQVRIPIEDLSENQIQLVGHLNRAVDTMNTLYRHQVWSRTSAMLDFLETVRDFLPEELHRRLDEYICILNLQNGPWAFIPRKNPLLAIGEKTVREAAKQAQRQADFDEFSPFFYGAVPFPEKAGFYPAAFSEADLQTMDEEARQVNTIVEEDGEGNYRSIRNEQRFQELCEKAVGHLSAARKYSEDAEFTLYLDAKIEELRTGSQEARRLADYHWIRHNSKVDLVLSTALEVYLDAWQNLKGSACGAVLVRNDSMEELLRKFVGKVADWERQAPWDWRREEIDPALLPRLKFVDVCTWSGDYVTSPQTVLAQSLPNDEWVGKNIGTVNMLYRNTGEAVHRVRGNLLAEEFLPAEIVEQYGSQLYYSKQIHAILHEIGHTTGRQDPDHPGQPSAYLKEEYSPLEEARAELFSMWSAQSAVQAGIISQETADAGQYSMLLSMINSLKFEASQAHNIARNVIFHFLQKEEGIQTVSEEGKSKLSLDLSRLHSLVEELLGRIGNIKAAGDRAAAIALRREFCFEDPMRPEIESRTASIPLGTGLIFPELKEKDGTFLRDLVYPEFIRQAKFNRET